MSERDFQQRIIDTAKHHGWSVHHGRPARTEAGWRTAVQGHPGFPDLVLAREGVVILAELKVGRGKLTLNQRRWIADAGRHGRVWRPEDWDAILAELSAPRGHSQTPGPVG